MRTTLERLKARKSEEEGFTLIELLIVIIILAILATIVIFAVGTTTKNAAVAACKSTVKSTVTALEAYKAQTATGSFPTSIATLTTTVTVTGTVKGPWLRSKPPLTTTTSGFEFTGYTTTNGKFTVVTKGTATGKTATTAAVCTGA